MKFDGLTKPRQRWLLLEGKHTVSKRMFTPGFECNASIKAPNVFLSFVMIASLHLMLFQLVYAQTGSGHEWQEALPWQCSSRYGLLLSDLPLVQAHVTQPGVGRQPHVWRSK